MTFDEIHAQSLDPMRHAEIWGRAQAGQSSRFIARAMHLPEPVVDWCRRQPPAMVRSDKKKAEFDWREWTRHAEKTQELYDKASQSQKFAHVRVGDGARPICLLPFSDTHIGSRGSNYKIFRKMTDEIIGTPDLYVLLVGDLVEMAIKLRSVSEVCAQIFEPAKQVQFMENWVQEIAHKVVGSVWDNHAVQREQAQSGVSAIKQIMSERFVYFDGIGHLDLQVGEQVYKIATSHKFRGYSYLNAAHAGQRYMRFQGVDREAAIMGDIHQPCFNWYYDGPAERISMVAGTLNTDSTYAARYFSIFTIPEFPCIEFHHKHHEKVPFKNLGTWVNHRGKK